ncbi:MAG: SDR family NAD(P)-dependent oxidoreductase [Chitinophagales bacterium]
MARAQTILITGASSGLGLELTHRLCPQGNIIIGVGRNAQTLEDIKEEECYGFMPVVWDLGQSEMPESLSQTLKNGPLPEWVILNAGVYRYQDLRNTDEYVRAVNYTTNVRLMENLSNLGVRSFVLVSSIMAFLPDTKLPAYGKSKADITAEFKRMKRAGLISAASFVVFPGPLQQKSGFLKGTFAACAESIIKGMKEKGGKDIYYPPFWCNALKLVNLFPKGLVRFVFKILRPHGEKR